MKKILITIGSLILLFVGAFYLYRTYATDTMNELFVSRFTDPEESEELVEEDTEEMTEEVTEEVTAQATEEVVEPSSEEEIRTVEIIDKPRQETTVVASIETTTREAIYMPEATFYSASGEPLELQSLEGKPIVLNFWASWCPPCVEEMPYFEQAYQEHGDDVQFVMLNATESRPGETIQAAQDFLVEHDLDLPVYYDQNYANQITFGISSLPSTLFINSDGEVVYGHRGLINDEQLEFMIAEVLE